jgi:formate hydrogenlyase subunit 3/multisubunit Na+/H+ antiporter MnhD subunit
LVAAQGAFVMGGCVSAVVGAWMALSAPLDDPDDFLVYAVAANGGFLLAGLGARSVSAGAGVALLLLARVLALLVLALAPRAGRDLRRWAYGVGILTLAGAPGLAGFPGLWLILGRITESYVAVFLVAASFLLFATGLRRWHVDEEVGPNSEQGVPGARRSVLALIVVLIVLGIAPQIAAPAFTGALRDIFLPFQ